MESSHDGVLRCIDRRGISHSLASVAHHGGVALWAACGLVGPFLHAFLAANRE